MYGKSSRSAGATSGYRQKGRGGYGDGDDDDYGGSGGSAGDGYGETAQRQAKRINRFQLTAEQLFATPPCRGATYVIMTLVVFWFVGIIYGAVRFSRAARDVGSVDDLEDLGAALRLIAQDREAQGSLVILGMFVGAMVIMWLYLGVVVLYKTIVHRKGVYLWMKRLEQTNGEDRKLYIARQQARYERMAAKFGGDRR